MIAKQGWFTRRKYSGWGFTPKSWQGWVYVAVLVLPAMIFSLLKVSHDMQTVLSVAWIVVVIGALFDISGSIVKDEREKIHEAIAERNALWIVITILAGGVIYETTSGVVQSAWDIDPIIYIALFGALITKAISNIYLDKKD